MTAERPDRGARALAELLAELHDQRDPDGIDFLRRTFDVLPSELADAILANGAVFLEDAAELERLREWLATEHAILRGPAHGYGGVVREAGDACDICAALEPEGSAQG